MAPETKWVRVTRHKPCPICDGKTWCGVSADGAVVRCMRTPSAKPAPSKDGEMGWIHRLVPETPRPVPMPRRPRSDTEPPPTDIEAVYRGIANDLVHLPLSRLSDRLGVTVHSLIRLGATWSRIHGAWAFPMFDVERRLIGVRLRAEDGRKWAVTGSHNGLFWPHGVPTPGPSTGQWLLICEGPTDCAALLDMGFDAIGRPSCSGAVDAVVGLAIRSHREICIVGDYDEPHARPDGTTWRPGHEGAHRLAEALTLARARPKIIWPAAPHKDVRAWRQAGAERRHLEAAIRLATYWRPDDGR